MIASGIVWTTSATSRTRSSIPSPSEVAHHEMGDPGVKFLRERIHGCCIRAGPVTQLLDELLSTSSSWFSAQSRLPPRSGAAALMKDIILYLHSIEPSTAPVKGSENCLFASEGEAADAPVTAWATTRRGCSVVHAVAAGSASPRSSLPTPAAPPP